MLNQPTIYAPKSIETYYTENTKSRETKSEDTEKLSTETEKQTKWALIETQRE